MRISAYGQIGISAMQMMTEYNVMYAEEQFMGIMAVISMARIPHVHTLTVQIHQTTFTSDEGCQVNATLVLDIRNDVSIDNVIRQQSLTLYPNPTTDYVQFDIQDQNLLNGQDFVMVYDLSGRLLQSLKPTSETIRINLSEYPSGTYIVKLANYIGKIVKR